MTRPLPSLDVWPAAWCPWCQEALQLGGMCGACGWDEARARAIRADLAAAIKRARTWQLGRVAS